MRPGITIAQSRQSPPPGGQSSNRNALQKHACRAEIVLFSTAGLGTVEIHAPDGQIQDHREKVASSRGHEPARHDNLIDSYIDCDLAVVAFYEAIAGRQDAAVRSVKFFCAR
jgi:hypothetical protein